MSRPGAGAPARPGLRARVRAFRSPPPPDPVGPRLAARVSALEEAVAESRQLHQRLADVVEVLTELLVPALDRDDARVKQALRNLGATLDEDSSSSKDD